MFINVKMTRQLKLRLRWRPEDHEKAEWLSRESPRRLRAWACPGKLNYWNVNKLNRNSVKKATLWYLNLIWTTFPISTIICRLFLDFSRNTSTILIDVKVRTMPVFNQSLNRCCSVKKWWKVAENQKETLSYHIFKFFPLLFHPFYSNISHEYH